MTTLFSAGWSTPMYEVYRNRRMSSGPGGLNGFASSAQQLVFTIHTLSLIQAWEIR